MPKLKIGADDFKKMRDEGGYFVDKSLLVREVIDGAPASCCRVRGGSARR